MTTVRNIAIILALAAVLAIAPGGGRASNALLQLLVIGMLSGIAWFAARLYREHRAEIYSLGERNRAILYGSAGLLALTITATERLWETGSGTIVWLALVALACYGVYYVFRAARQY